MLRIVRPYVEHPMGLYYFRHMRRCLHNFMMVGRCGQLDVKTVLQKIFQDVDNADERYILSFKFS